jgi:hypothetical protein
MAFQVITEAAEKRNNRIASHHCQSKPVGTQAGKVVIDLRQLIEKAESPTKHQR